MPELTGRTSHHRPSGGARVFADAAGRLWTAASLDGADGVTVVFTCISDGRQSGRALLVRRDPGPVLEDREGAVPEDTLRAWLEAAPRIGLLT